MYKGFKKIEDEVEEKKESLDNNKINDERIANKLCCISLFFYCITIIYKWINQFANSISYNINNFVLVRLFYIMVGLAPLTAYIIMIIVRVKYPKNKFGKILMIVYNLSMILFIIWMGIILNQCLDSLNNCPG